MSNLRALIFRGKVSTSGILYLPCALQVEKNASFPSTSWRIYPSLQVRKCQNLRWMMLDNAYALQETAFFRFLVPVCVRVLTVNGNSVEMQGGAESVPLFVS